ncbi:MAG: hypothetical protein AABY26_05985 [Nanoarchaeota archaeon]
MRLEKHLESLHEVMDEIGAALNDSRGLSSHQRRLALMLSVGFCELVEIYFHKLQILKPGSRIKHDWFRQKRIKEKLEQQVTSPLSGLAGIDEIISLAVQLEESRDDLAYGSPVNEEEFIRSRIDLFLKMKKIIENRVGGIDEPK